MIQTNEALKFCTKHGESQWNATPLQKHFKLDTHCRDLAQKLPLEDLQHLKRVSTTTGTKASYLKVFLHVAYPLFTRLFNVFWGVFIVRMISYSLSAKQANLVHTQRNLVGYSAGNYIFGTMLKLTGPNFNDRLNISTCEQDSAVQTTHTG